MKMAKCIVELERIYGIKHGGKDFYGNQFNKKESSNNFKTPNQEELAEQIGLTPQQLHNYKKLTTLIPELQDLVESNKLKATTAYKIYAILSQEE
ncbi:hypothetical protein [Desulforamulus aeronauticus]|uniref:ParB/Spo0J HTH domain-containing protein n=1 Tax=Desulforamulus aeronauticus DSM 10349 TaxID=1121421 RepID=A0A1M6SA92_9FIRM|nr:hypothetical protein [Desulforamulus aeronauticus]SHK41713.1 hypothetical protein SAMN02745123_01768 [Desulforamulus aeronauticus DSM 10349]